MSVRAREYIFFLYDMKRLLTLLSIGIFLKNKKPEIIKKAGTQQLQSE